MKIRDKGFFVTMGVCILAVGAVAAVSLSYVLPREKDTVPPVTTTTTPTTAATTAQQVQTPVTDVPDLRTTTPITTTDAATVTTTEVPAADLYVLPLTNEVKKAFSNGELVYSETMQDWRVHNGTDFAGKEGAEVKAAANGTVKAIFEDTLWGNTVEIDHGFGIVSRYCGVSARGIKVGDSVRVGEPIGVLSAVPCEEADGAHLHLEILSSEKALDPVAVIGLEVRNARE
ncbi:MAG: M23 family metallopeptidase [Ruminococcaceae bacterium]|nr:M23 family metallopeptidase [Oscillospiraceae bacterium]